MCDTMVALGSVTASTNNIFAKNSDRGPNEPQYFTFIPASEHEAGSTVKCTYIDIDQVEHTHAVILSKPSWIWGGEMGVNEHGVVIGNEAIWTKMPYGEPALLGMDMLRLGLERGSTASQAVDVLIEMLEKYGQGGNCAFDGEFHYHNTFLVVDRNEAFILETAGEFWAVERVKDIRTISNVMSVSDFERIHPGAIPYAIEQGWCETEEDFDFCTTFLDHKEVFGMGGSLRSGCTNRVLRNAKGEIDIDSMLKALRAHNSNEPWADGGFSAPCMHATEEGGNQSTASLIAEVRADGSMLFFGTGMSTPHVAPFKPFWFDAYSSDLVFDYDKQEEAVAAWVHREGINRAFVAGKLDEKSYLEEMGQLEASWKAEAEKLESASQEERQEFCERVMAEETAFIDRWLSEADQSQERADRSEEFTKAWDYWNEELGKDKRLAI